MPTRRNFIQQAGLLAAGALISPSLIQAMPKAAKRKIGLQLYSLHQEIEKDVKSVIAKVSAAGYNEVETFGYSPKGKFWGLNPKDFSDLLKANNLTTYSGHYGMEHYLKKDGSMDELKYSIDAAAAIGQKYVTIPFIAGYIVENADGYKQVAEKLNKAGELCKSAGLKLAYHNHDFEFKITNEDISGYEILLKQTQSSLVDFELDLYWAVRASINPINLFSQYPGRFTMWHVKDMDKVKPQLNTEVGTGSIDFAKIFDNAKLSGLKQLFVEQENYSKDPFVSIKESRDYLAENILKS